MSRGQGEGRVFVREEHAVAHVVFRLTVDPEIGATFALIAGEAEEPRYRRPLFSAHIPRGMAAQLRVLADRIEEIEAKSDG